MSSDIILGTVQFGLEYGINNTTGKPSENQVFEIFDYAAQHGVKILDTADAYGNATKLLGRFIFTYPGTLKVNTKFQRGDTTIRNQLLSSLGNLHLNQIDTYFYHDFSDFKLYPDLLTDLILLKKETLIENIGLSVYDNNELKSAIDSPEIDVIQLPFNLLDNEYLRGDLLRLAKANGKQIQVRSVFLQGLFFKSLAEIPISLNTLMPYLKKIREIAKKNYLTLEQLALQYVLQQSYIDYVIIGVDNLDQLKRNLLFTKESLLPEIVQMINEIKVKEIYLLYPKNWQ